MKKFKLLIIALAAAVFIGVAGVQPATVTKADTADSYASSEWMPFNYVLSEGFGSQMKLLDIRTNLSYADGKLTASGTTTKGGMGVTFLPEVTLDGFSMNVSYNNWQGVSPDRWFGVTFTDVGVKTDDVNEVPVYTKHSESWSNAYGAGALFCSRPMTNGELTVQFNTIGINGTYDADLNYATNAGEYNDGLLGWGGWLSTIQLYNTDWTVKTDYNNIEITVDYIYDGQGEITGYGFDINNGYWKRTDSVAWDELAADVLAQLGVSSSAELTDEIKDKFLYGPAYEGSIIPYANWGDTMWSLYKFEQNLKAEGKRLYMSYMYKDAWDMREGSGEASFTINSVNGKNATTGGEYTLVGDKSVEGTMSATVKEENLHAGVYPSMVKSIVKEAAVEKTYASAKANIEALAGKKNKYEVFNVKAALDGDVTAEFISTVEVDFNISSYKNAKVYKIVGEELDLIGEGEAVTLSVKSSDTNFVIVYSEGGCGGVATAGSVLGVVILGGAACALNSLKKKRNA